MAFCLALVASSVAYAAPPPSAERVAVHAVGPLYGPALERALGAWFSMSPYQLDFMYEGQLDGQRLLRPAPDHVVHAWLSMESGFAYVRLARSDRLQPHRRYLLRRLRLAGELDLLALEQLAQMTHFAIEALLSQQVATPEPEFVRGLPDAARAPPSTVTSKPARVPAPLDASTRSRSLPPPKTRLLRIAFELPARARGTELLAYGPGISGAIQWTRSGWALGPLVRLSYVLPARAQHQELELTFRGQGAGIGLLLSQSSKFGWDVAVGGHLERTELDVKSSSPSLGAQVVPVDLRWNALLEAGVHLGLLGARLGVRALLLLPLPASHYVLAELDGEREVFSPWRLQPGLMVEVGPLL